MKRLQALREAIRAEMARGKGVGRLYPHAVQLEPPFSPYDPGHLPNPAPPEPRPPAPSGYLHLSPSTEDDYGRPLAEQLLLALGPCCPLAFEVIGSGGRATLQLAVGERHLDAVAEQLLAHHRHAQVRQGQDRLDGATLAVARAYRLRRSHLFVLRSDQRTEPYAALLGVLAASTANEVSLFQVLVCPAVHDWRSNALRMAVDPWNPSHSAFVDLPDLPRRADHKMARPLFAVAVRLASTDMQALDRLQGAFLSQFQSEENAFAPRGGAPPLESILTRTTHTPGVLLNSEELAALVHVPDPGEVPPATLARAVHSAPAPELARRDIVVPLGSNRHREAETPVGISADWLTRHVALFGATGSGKTNTLKCLLAVVDAGFGLAFLDPAGDAALEFLDLIPPHRTGDVIYFDPTDRDWPPALNMLASRDAYEGEMLAAELVRGLRLLYRDSWGPRLEWIVRQAVRTLLLSEG